MYFFIRTQNMRPTFQLDMTAEEREVMQRHVAYWTEKATQGIAIVFGPVLDPKGVYGIGVYQAKDEAEMKEMLDLDPANGLLQVDVLPMARAVVGKLND
jgi:uncharacterized protein YciI